MSASTPARSTRRDASHPVAGGLAVIALALILAGCATGRPPGVEATSTWAGRAIGPRPASNPALKRAIIARANGEWEYFGRQTVVYRGSEESIPHVGYWEDDDPRHSQRVNAYWRAVGQPTLDGMDCDEPWSAAFISWVMQRAGVPQSQFRPAIAHWVYLSAAIDDAALPGRWFVPQRISDYSPRPGDLICSSRGPRRPGMIGGYTSPGMLRGTNTHCDLVTATDGKHLEAIGGNVRNSVSKISVELDAQGRLRTVPRRPWFMILQNRL
ncbi:MAG: DUF2272 domain-containing protein [Thiohalocapsa sp.]|uniref:DUF2272 domain-containing protein n=1 Tax=Thiohalocapsa sp. TaxID=2497641 RepID=UPI0025DF5B17|nr:DUF2272 domain-containing protein [Thiohalocapsa sp.]MCG6941137.1 DUF2272 domain-containing protein [Thiohalocapsa sp.]